MTQTSPSPLPDHATLLAAYDAQLRGEREAEGDYAPIGPLSLGRFAERGFVSYRDLGDAEGQELDALIDAVVAFYRDQTDVPSFEWKTRGHDRPADLTDRLRAHGFVPEDEESVMVGSITGVVADVVLPDGVTVRRVEVDDVEGYTHAHAMQEHVFNNRWTTVEDSMNRAARSEGRRALYVAESPAEAEHGHPWGGVVAAGTIEVVAGTAFAGVWGGAALAHWRGRGIYRALTSARAAYAQSMGATYLHSDSTEYSRPILERSGLVKVTTTTPYIWTR